MRLLLLALLFTAPSFAQTRAGLMTRVIHPAQPRNWRGAERKELHVTLWYPAAVEAHELPQTMGPPDAPLMVMGSAAPNAEFAPSLAKLPLVLLSHGTGGSAQQMAWMGTALARAGFIAAAVDHPGNNATEPYTAEGFTLWWERATDLSNVLDGLLADPEFGPRIDPTRVGAAGFSIGGYTVMELAGAQTDLSVLYDDCRKHPDQVVCNVPEIRKLGTWQQLLETTRKSSGESLARSADSFRDPRIKAVFAIAPAVSETQTSESLRAIRTPVEIVVGAADPIAPADRNADYLQANMRGARETVLPGNVSHYTFLSTCTAAGKAGVHPYCDDAPDVDRDKVHAQVAGMAITFFTRSLHIGKGKR